MVDLAELVEDVEHVILEFDETSGLPHPTEVFAAAERSGRELSLVGGTSEPPSAVPRLLVTALEAWASRHGATLDEAHRVSVYAGVSPGCAQAAETAGIRCIVSPSWTELADALNARWDAQWCSRQYCC